MQICYKCLMGCLSPLRKQPHIEKLTRLRITEASELIRLKKLSPVELTTECLANIGRLNPTLNCFISVTADTALAQAKLLDADSKSREVAVKEREVAVHEMEAKTENSNRDLDRADKFKESAIALAGKVIGAPTAGESGKQVSTDAVGKKTSKIIKDVDKGLK